MTLDEIRGYVAPYSAHFQKVGVGVYSDVLSIGENGNWVDLGVIGDELSSADFSKFSKRVLDPILNTLRGN